MCISNNRKSLTIGALLLLSNFACRSGSDSVGPTSLGGPSTKKDQNSSNSTASKKPEAQNSPSKKIKIQPQIQGQSPEQDEIKFETDTNDTTIDEIPETPITKPLPTTPSLPRPPILAPPPPVATPVTHQVRISAAVAWQGPPIYDDSGRINCPVKDAPGCTGNFEHGTSITLRAPQLISADAGSGFHQYHFNHWLCFEALYFQGVGGNNGTNYCPATTSMSCTIAAVMSDGVCYPWYTWDYNPNYSDR